jgi:hypothetical protein
MFIGISYTISFSVETPLGSNPILDRSDHKRTTTRYRNHDFKTRKRMGMMFTKILPYNIQV